MSQRLCQHILSLLDANATGIFFLYECQGREEGGREAWRPTRRLSLTGCTDSLSSRKNLLSTAGLSNSSVGDMLPEEPAAVCLWPLLEVFAAHRGTKVTWLLLNMFYSALNMPLVKKKRETWRARDVFLPPGTVKCSTCRLGSCSSSLLPSSSELARKYRVEGKHHIQQRSKQEIRQPICCRFLEFYESKYTLILGGLGLLCGPEIEARPRSCLNLSSMVITAADLEFGTPSSSAFGGGLS